MTTRSFGRAAVGLVSLSLLVLSFSSGCAIGVNHFKEDGPSTTMNWDSPTTADVRARFAEAPPRERGWEATTVAAESGGVYHYPLYFEDPFVDKGHGRTDETHPHDVYRGGWEDYVALPYCPARFVGNVLLFPASVVVTPPWTIMESDGRLSKQLLGYDHDATPAHDFVPQAPPAASGEAKPEADKSAPAEPGAPAKK